MTMFQLPLGYLSFTAYITATWHLQISVSDKSRNKQKLKNPLTGFHCGCQATTLLQTELVHFSLAWRQDTVTHWLWM